MGTHKEHIDEMLLISTRAGYHQKKKMYQCYYHILWYQVSNKMLYCSTLKPCWIFCISDKIYEYCKYV